MTTQKYSSSNTRTIKPKNKYRHIINAQPVVFKDMQAVKCCTYTTCFVENVLSTSTIEHPIRIYVEKTSIATYIPLRDQ